jgi:hypothetical protein
MPPGEAPLCMEKQDCMKGLECGNCSGESSCAKRLHGW